MSHFRRRSHHTCLCPDWYASATLLASSKKSRPLSVDLSCVPCRITNDFRKLVKGEKVSTSIERQQKLNLILQELVSTNTSLDPFLLFIIWQAEIMAQDGLKLELPDSDSGTDISLSPIVSFHL